VGFGRQHHPDQPVRPVEPVVEQKAESAMLVLAPCNEETLLARSVQDDEELVDHEATPRMQQHVLNETLVLGGGGRKSANGNLPHDVSIP